MITDLDAALARYAEDPSAVTADERAAIEAWLATAEADPATIAVARAAAPAVTPPDWNQLARSITAATTGATRRRWPMWIGAATLAAAAAVAIVTVRAAQVPLAWTAEVEPSAIDRDALDEALAADVAATPDGELAAMGAIDDELIDAVAAYDDERPDDDVPAIGAAWTSWLDEVSDDELDRALAWLESEEPT